MGEPRVWLMPRADTPKEFARLHVVMEQRVRQAKYWAYGAVGALWAYWLFHLGDTPLVQDPEMVTYAVGLGIVTYICHRKLMTYEDEVKGEWSRMWRRRLERCESPEEAEALWRELDSRRKEWESAVVSTDL